RVKPELMQSGIRGLKEQEAALPPALQERGDLLVACLIPWRRDARQRDPGGGEPEQCEELTQFLLRGRRETGDRDADVANSFSYRRARRRAIVRQRTVEKPRRQRSQ